MARKSSKTTHVMNLLSGEDSDSSKSETAKEDLAASHIAVSTETVKEVTVLAQQASIQTQDGLLSPSPISIIDMSASAPDPVAELIKQQLEAEEETENEEPAPQPPASTEEHSKQEATSLPEISPMQELPSAESPALEEPVSDIPSYQYLNVMEHVVKSKVNAYMEKFDVCTCGCCTADVTALTLTHLPPKYIVVEPPSASPLLNYYSNFLSQQVIVELIKACSVVKENPHH